MKLDLILNSRSILFIILLLFINIKLSAQPSLKIISPNGGEKLKAGSFQSIIWTQKNIAKINISYSKDSSKTWIPIYSNIGTELGVISWKIPNLIGKHILIKIQDVNGNYFDVSDSYFTIDADISLKGSLNKISKTNATTVIMPLGNSITYDNRVDDNRPVGDRTGYRVPLYSLLTSAGYDFDFTGSEHAGGNYLPAGYDDNAGFPGIKDDQLANLLITGRRVQPPSYDYQVTPGPYLDVYPADIILLHIGTNGNQKADGTDPIDAENILDEIKRYEDSTGTEITVILARIINRSPNETYVTTLNDNVEAMALDRVNNPANDAYPDKIVIVDMENGAGIDYTIDSMGTVGNGIPGDMNDLYHPNDKGYSKMAQVWFDAIVNLLPGKPLITSQPHSKNTIEGESVVFTINASGNPPLSYQWKKNGLDIENGTQQNLVLDNVSAADDSSIITCLVSNLSGNVLSDSVMLYVTGENERVKSGLEILYTFNESNGSIVYDNSQNLIPVNLQITDTSNLSWIPYGLSIDSTSILTSDSTPQNLFNHCVNNDELSIETWIKPKYLLQSGPARIITYSADGSNRNFTLAQREDRYVIRLRTTTTDLNGLPEITTSNAVVDTALTHLFFTKDSSGTVKLFVNGAPRIISTLSGTFSNWDSSFSLALGNEFESNNTSRFWLGNFYLTGIYSRALSESEVLHNYSIGFDGKAKLLFPPTNLNGEVIEDTLVSLNWTDNENNELGYIVERKANDIDSVYYAIDSLAANTIVYTDSLPKYVTSYLYRVKAYGSEGESDYSNIAQVDNIVTDIKNDYFTNDFALYQNYPNPFNPSTTISFNIPNKSKVNLVVYNTLGEVVEKIYNNKILGRGFFSVNFSSQNLTSGIYFYKITVKSLTNSSIYFDIKKLILLK